MNVVKISLEAGVRATLDWSNEKELAQQAIQDGKTILWDLQLGLFDKLIHPFSHQSQFLSLSLSLDHFKEQIWAEYKDRSTGVSLYEGPADFTVFFPWDDAQKVNLQEWLKNLFINTHELETETGNCFACFEAVTPQTLSQTAKGKRLVSLFCRDASIEYLNLLAANIPDEIPLFAFLDSSHIEDPALLYQLTTAEKYERITPIINGVSTSKEAKTAICLPPSNLVKSGAIEGLSVAIQHLQNVSVAYKIIPESSLIIEWDELDNLIVCADGLGPQGLRKLQGFCAAGGTVITLGKPLGLPYEVPFESWKAT